MTDEYPDAIHVDEHGQLTRNGEPVEIRHPDSVAELPNFIAVCPFCDSTVTVGSGATARTWQREHIREFHANKIPDINGD